MIITGKCSICGRPVGIQASELGKVKPPAKCPACDHAVKDVMDLFGTLRDKAVAKARDE